jgi:hypothetical protein
MKVRGPFLSFDCSECGHTIYYSVNPKKVEQELEEMKERENRFCAMCSYIKEKYGE